jgi:ABC-type transport system substrate-binding protein
MAVPIASGAGAPSPEVVKPTGDLRIALAFLGGQRFIPWTEFISGGIKQYMMLIYDYLVGCTDDGQLSPEGGIAQRWEQAPDKLNWTFTLRQGVKFHDGTEVTAEDVKFSIDSLFEPKAVAALLGPTKAAFKEAEIKDPYTLVSTSSSRPFFSRGTSRVPPAARASSCPRSRSSRAALMGSPRTRSAAGPIRW